MIPLALRPFRHRIGSTFRPVRSQRAYQTTHSNPTSTGSGGRGALLGGAALILTMGAYVWNNVNEGKAVANLEMKDNAGDDNHNKTPTGKKIS